MKFSDIIGQDEIKTHLKNAIRTGQVSHAYIISGEKESGKRMLAEAFACTLLCDEGGDDACGNCKSCRQTEGHNNPDLIYVTHEKTGISVNDIRQQVNATVDLKPFSHARKIYIIDEAEKMNEIAQNALLKTIEEPPSYVTIILLTTNENVFLQTILSRCIRLSLKPVHPDKIRKYLMQKHGIPDYHADMCIAFAQGNMGKALQLAASEEFNARKEAVTKLVRKLREIPEYDLSEEAAIFTERKEEFPEMLNLLQIWYRDVLLCKAVGERAEPVYREELSWLKRQAAALSYGKLERNFQSIERAREAYRANVNMELLTEQLLRELKE